MTSNKDKNVLVLVDLFKDDKSTISTNKVRKLIKKMVTSKVFDEIIFIQNKKRTNYLKCVSFADFFIKNKDFTKNFNNVHTFDFEGLSFLNEDFITLLKKINNEKVPHKIFIAGENFIPSIFKSVLDIYDKSEITPFILKKYILMRYKRRENKRGLKTLSSLIGDVHVLKDNIFKKKFKKEWLVD